MRVLIHNVLKITNLIMTRPALLSSNDLLTQACSRWGDAGNFSWSMKIQKDTGHPLSVTTRDHLPPDPFCSCEAICVPRYNKGQRRPTMTRTLRPEASTRLGCDFNAVIESSTSEQNSYWHEMPDKPQCSTCNSFLDILGLCANCMSFPGSLLLPYTDTTGTLDLGAYNIPSQLPSETPLKQTSDSMMSFSRCAACNDSLDLSGFCQGCANCFVNFDESTQDPIGTKRAIDSPEKIQSSDLGAIDALSAMSTRGYNTDAPQNDTGSYAATKVSGRKPGTSSHENVTYKEHLRERRTGLCLLCYGDTQSPDVGPCDSCYRYLELDDTWMKGWSTSGEGRLLV